MVKNNLIKDVVALNYHISLLATKVVNSEIIEVKKRVTNKTKYAPRYYYCGGGYDTETTTVKQECIRVGLQYYPYNRDKNTYTIARGDVFEEHILDVPCPEKYVRNNIIMMPEFAYVYHVQMMINGNYYTFRDINIAGDFLIKLSDAISTAETKIAEKTTSKVHNHKNKIDKYGYTKLVIWIANLNFEFSFLKSVLCDNNITSSFAKNTTSPLIISIGDVIEMRECIGLFGNSLDKIAKDYTSTKKLKGDLDYNLIRTSDTPLTDKEQEYCYNDVKILDELSYIALDMYPKNGQNYPLTQTGIVRAACKKALGKDYKKVCAENSMLMPGYDIAKSIRIGEGDVDDYAKIQDYDALYTEWRRMLYTGGYAHSNSMYIGKILHNVKCADITSDYPYQINKHNFPAGKIVHCNEPDKYNSLYKSGKCCIIKIHIVKCHAKTTHTLISKNKILNIADTHNCIWDNGRLHYGENLDMWCTEIDLNCIVEMYHGVIIITDLWYFTSRRKAPRYLTDTMNYYYSKKQKLKADGKSDTIDYKIAKQLVNAFYGMCGTRIYQTITKLSKNLDFEECEDDSYNYCDCINSMWLNPYIAYYTTAYARAIICHFVAKYPELIVQYDTDSIYFINQPTDLVSKNRISELKNEIYDYNNTVTADNIRKYRDKHMWDLGTWDMSEPAYNRFKCLGAKRYLCETYPDADGNVKLKPVIAGCPKQAFIDFCKNERVDAFTYFDNAMTLSIHDSSKLNAKYRPYDVNGWVYGTIVDYRGNTGTYKYNSYCALYEVAFTVNLDSTWLSELARISIHDNMYPPAYRSDSIAKLLYRD